MQVSLYPVAKRNSGVKPLKPYGGVLFSGKQKPQKSAKSKKQFGIKSLFSAVTYLALASAMVGQCYRSFQAFADLFYRDRYKSSVLYHAKGLPGGTYKIYDTRKDQNESIGRFNERLESLYVRSNTEKSPTKWTTDVIRMGKASYDVFDSLVEDNVLFEKYAQSHSSGDLDTLYHHYVERPESFENFTWGKIDQTTSPRMLWKLRQAYDQRLFSCEGKFNPVSKDEFALLTDTYLFFQQASEKYPEYRRFPEPMYRDYLGTVIAKHAQNPNLPALKAYYQNAVKLYEKAITINPAQEINTVVTKFFLGELFFAVMMFAYWDRQSVLKLFRSVKTLPETK